MAKKILSFLEELVNEKEFIYPFYRVQEAGYEVDVAANEIKGVTGESGMALADINVKVVILNVMIALLPICAIIIRKPLVLNKS